MDTPTTPSTPHLVPSEDFANKYANHVHFEISPWDLKMTFGQLDSKIGANGVVQHTSITLPWPQAKVMAYMLQMNVLIHEQLNGKVVVPSGIIPKPEAAHVDSQRFKDGDAVINLLLDEYDRFMKANPEAVRDAYSKQKTK